MNKKKKQHLINGEIRASEVRVTDNGVMSLSAALALADSQELDLVLIGPTASPPVAKIMNYEKYIYSLNKTPTTKQPKRKEIKISINIGENDLNIKLNHMIQFLKDGHQVLLSMQLKGREMAFSEKGLAIVLQTILKIKEYGSAEQMPKLEGKKIFANIRPLIKK